MDRRTFLAESGCWSLGVILGSLAGSRALQAAEATFIAPPFGRKPLPGACMQPGDKVEKTLAAVLETVVPGKATDPDGEPGAVEACALGVLMDSSFPFRPYASILATVLDNLAITRGGTVFAKASADDRIAVLLQAQEQLPMLRLAFRAVRAAFFGGAYNGVGFDYVGYPGPNLGYRHLPQCSFRKPVCKEMTDTGWLP